MTNGPGIFAMLMTADIFIFILVLIFSSSVHGPMKDRLGFTCILVGLANMGFLINNVMWEYIIRIVGGH